MMVIDTSKVLGCLEMDDDLLVEEPAAEMVYLRDQLVAVIKYADGIPEEEIVSINRDHMLVLISGISCWMPYTELEEGW